MHGGVFFQRVLVEPDQFAQRLFVSALMNHPVRGV
jgi:hypothetical protein